MIEAAHHIDKLIREVITLPFTDEQFYAVKLYQLTVCPNEAALEEATSELVRRSTDIRQLASIPSNRRFELLALAYLIQQSFGKQPQLTKLNESLFRLAVQDLHEGKWGYTTGGAGILNYFALSAPENEILFYVESLMETIAVLVGENPYQTARQQSEFQADHSLAEGLIGWLMALMNALKLLKDNERIGLAVSEVSAYLDKQLTRLADGITSVDSQLHNYSFFPRRTTANSDTIFVSNAMNWSEGDLGQVALFYKAADLLNKPVYRALAEQIGLYTLTRRTVTSTEIIHSDLRSGSLGLAFMYRALEQYNPKYSEGCAFWRQKSLKLIDEDLESGHFESKSLALLDGWIGLALLLDALGRPTKPDDWTKMLLGA